MPDRPANTYTEGLGSQGSQGIIQTPKARDPGVARPQRIYEAVTVTSVHGPYTFAFGHIVMFEQRLELWLD
ncbi:hypothetical protein Ct61P_05715 [Colletotrichum tofieldiae]|nr:hypothetical protein Ct61P_05715 [Colletotrichum tofieldiae]